jgi:hypothetical protein
MKTNIEMLSSLNTKETLALDIKDLKLHELVNEHPAMTEAEFERLKESILDIGQLEPILVYKGEVVDGRHRYWALEALNISEVLAKEIPSNTPLDTVKEIVFSSEIRRHQTGTQKAIKAWMYIQESGITYREAEAKFMTSRTMISACSYIAKTRGTAILDDLYANKSVSIGKRTSTSLRTIQTLIKEEEDRLQEKRFSKKRDMSTDKAREEAKPYMDALTKEPLLVIECVASGAYKLLRERE